MTRLDLSLWFAILGMEVVLVGLLIRGRVYKLLPIFCLYMVWTIASDLGMMIVQRLLGNNSIQILEWEILLDSALQCAVLMELAWSVLRPIRSSLPRWTIFAIIILILAVVAIVWPLSGFTQMHNITWDVNLIRRLEQTISIVRILFFVVLAAASQLLSLSWRDRELQIATGLGFYSLISLAAGLLHTQMPTVAHYHPIDQIMISSYLFSLVYWAVSFAQKEAPRQEFSPEMRSFLLKVSGAAHADRIALQDRTLSGRGPR